MRASEPSDAGERQDPREVRNQKAPDVCPLEHLRKDIDHALKFASVTRSRIEDWRDRLSAVLVQIRASPQETLKTIHTEHAGQPTLNRLANDYARTFNGQLEAHGIDLSLYHIEALVALFRHAIEHGGKPLR